MTTSIDSLYKYTTTTSISILTLIPCYSYIPPRSPHHLVQQTRDSSGPNKQPLEQHVSYCNYKAEECCNEPNQTTVTVILPREVKLTLGLLCRSPLNTNWSRSSAYWMLLLRGCCQASMLEASSICVAVLYRRMVSVWWTHRHRYTHNSGEGRGQLCP